MEQRRGGINTSNRMRIELNPKPKYNTQPQTQTELKLGQLYILKLTKILH